MYIEDALVEAEVVPAQSECFSLADAGADENLDKIGHERIGRMAVPQEGDSLVDGPDVALGCCRPGDDRGPCGVVVEPVVPDRPAECAGQGGEDPVNGDWAPSARELRSDEGRDVAVAEIVELDLPERGDEIVLDI
ncbi:hypothetical protein [Streptomyces sp. NPDC037389]|uniref:hypothetical protein n=1 Tax=Streptomyces sp. NPDC037389 TaxID=3155369 RepID=UPI0033DA0800